MPIHHVILGTCVSTFIISLFDDDLRRGHQLLCGWNAAETRPKSKLPESRNREMFMHLVFVKCCFISSWFRLMDYSTTWLDSRPRLHLHLARYFRGHACKSAEEVTQEFGCLPFDALLTSDSRKRNEPRRSKHILRGTSLRNWIVN